MHYIAWLLTQGAVPYRDAFDMNVPGVYLVHLAVLAVGGSGDWPWRLFGLCWLAPPPPASSPPPPARPRPPPPPPGGVSATAAARGRPGGRGPPAPRSSPSTI